MSGVFANILPGKGKGVYKISSETSLFERLDIPDGCRIPYAPEHKLDDGYWFVVDNFSFREFCPDILKKKFHSIDYGQLENNFSKIAFIFSLQNRDFYFQKITPGRWVKKKRWFKLGEATEVIKMENGFYINELPDAVYFKEQDALAFKSLSTISSVFDGISSLYREATEEETNCFLNSPFISLANKYESSKVKTQNRQRIAMATDKLEKMTAAQKKKLILYTAKYDKELKFDKKICDLKYRVKANLKSYCMASLKIFTQQQ